MKRFISSRQIIFTLIISLFALKVLLLPNLMARDMGRDIYIFTLFLCILDFLVLLMLLYLMNKYDGMTFFEIVSHFFGGHVARIIMLLFMLFFFAKACGAFQSAYVYLNENLYTTYTWLTYSLPILLVLILCVQNGLVSFARTIEVCFPLIVLGFLMASFVGVIRADITNLLPVLEDAGGKFLSITKFAFWFGDYLVLIPFFGRIEKNNEFSKKVTLSLLLSIALLVLFYVIVYCRYSYNIISHTNAISDILQVQPSSSDIGNFDWVLILIWDICLFLYLGINFVSASHCFKETFYPLKQIYVSLILCVAVLLVNFFLQFNIYSFVILAQDSLLYYSIAVQYCLPLVIFLVSLCKKRRKNEVSLAQ